MRRLLLLYGLAMTTAVLVAFLVPLGLLARSLAQERALDAGRQDAQSVAVFAGAVAADAARLEAAVLDLNTGPRTTTVFRPDGSVVGPTAPRTTAVEVATGGRALTARIDGGVEVLLPVGGSDGVSVVRTFVPNGELTAGVARSWLVLALVGAVVLAATAIAADRIAARLSRSVRDLATVAGRLGAGDLTARVEPSGPREVVAVGQVLNGLGARVSALLADERELVADLSHRLRTPITALRLNAELLTDPAEREQVTGHVDQLVTGLDAIVWAARHRRHDGPSGRCDAAAVVRERARFWEVLAAEQGRELQVSAEGAAEVGLSAEELGAALDVLIDNVFSHTPDGTAFRLAATPGAAGPDGTAAPAGPGAAPVVSVVVEDDGPGFADVELAERGRSGAGSTGLGLDVARRAAERAAGHLVLGAGAAGGARIVLRLPTLREP